MFLFIYFFFYSLCGLRGGRQFFFKKEKSVKYGGLLEVNIIGISKEQLSKQKPLLTHTHTHTQKENNKNECINK